jgi:nitroreductase
MARGSDARVQPPRVGEPGSAQWAATLIAHRQTILPKRLTEPGPDVSQLELIFGAAADAPDHGELVPWRFVVIPAASRGRLAQVFEASLLERDPAAAPEQLAQAREKAFRSPVLMLAVVDLGPADDDIAAAERVLSAGCAIQNMLLMATALGFGSSLTSGKALQSQGLRELFSLRACEQAVCFLNIGTAVRGKAPRLRPEPNRYISFLAPPSP